MYVCMYVQNISLSIWVYLKSWHIIVKNAPFIFIVIVHLAIKSAFSGSSWTPLTCPSKETAEALFVDFEWEQLEISTNLRIRQNEVFMSAQ